MVTATYSIISITQVIDPTSSFSSILLIVEPSVETLNCHMINKHNNNRLPSEKSDNFSDPLRNAQLTAGLKENVYVASNGKV